MLESNLLVFIGASAALAIAPGPDNIFVLTQSAIKGKVAGLVVTLGLCTGLLVHTTLVAFGVAAVFAASALAFRLLKFAGAAYLLYLAWGAFRAGSSAIKGEDVSLSLRRYYLRGIVMNVTNPKVSIFFLAFLPQFARPEAGNLPLQLVTLGLVFILVAFVVFGLISLLAGQIGGWFRRSKRAQQGLNWLAGCVFVGLALKLVSAER